MIGEEDIIKNRVRKYCLVALEKTEVLVLSQRNFENIV